MNKFVIILSIIIAVISVYILVAIELPQKPLAGQGGNVNENVDIGGDFTLIDHNDEIFYSDTLKGKLSLIYFGFTYCPDICPTSLNKLSEVLRNLDKYKIDITPIFISVDPNRDRPALLKEYLGHFHPKFIGLTGSQEEIKQVADLYKVYYVISEDKAQDDKHYMIDHSSFVYLMDKNGKYLKHFYMNSPAEEIVEFIRINK